MLQGFRKLSPDSVPDSLSPDSRIPGFLQRKKSRKEIAMETIKATWKNGQVVLDHMVNWPEGRRLLVLESPPPDMDFMTEEEQSDDPEAIQKWIDDLRAIPPLSLHPDEEADLLAWRQRMKNFNTEAVRRQMEEETP
jgi:hypothetical protein